MKKHFFLLLFTVVVVALQAQNGPELKNSELKADIQDIADQAANDLRSCCSKWGGNDLQALIHWDEKDYDENYMTRLSKLTNVLNITMTVSWTGSMSGTYYWIKGKLSYNLDNGSRNWTKISDSGGFTPGCSQGCIE